MFILQGSHQIISYPEKPSINHQQVASNICIPGQRASSFSQSPQASNANFF
jgi:hypothetical protein